MSCYADDPFQMDEDFAAPEELPLPTQHTARLQAPPARATPEKLATLEKDITPRYEDVEPQAFAKDAKLLRSRLAHIKLEDGAGTTTEEDELTYEEDVDDKFDKDAAAKLEAAFVESQAQLAEQPLTPPENFAPVINRIYRLSFPQVPNFAFLKKLRLRLVLCLIPEEYPKVHQEFFEKEGIQLFQLGMLGNKEPFVKISSELITDALKIVLDPANHPILIHCNRGKHRTGCLVGVLRRLQGWSLTIIFDEYRKFAAPKERPMDQQFIELYDELRILHYAEEKHFLPMRWD